MKRPIKKPRYKHLKNREVILIDKVAFPNSHVVTSKVLCIVAGIDRKKGITFICAKTGNILYCLFSPETAKRNYPDAIFNADISRLRTFYNNRFNKCIGDIKSGKIRVYNGKYASPHSKTQKEMMEMCPFS